MIKDTGERSDEEVHRERSGRVPSTGTSVSWSWGLPPYQHVNMFTNLEARECCTLEIFMEGWAGRHDQIINLISSPSLLPKKKILSKFQVSHLGLVFLVFLLQHSSCIYTRSPPGLIILKQKMLLSPRKFQIIQELCIRKWIRDQILETKVIPGISITCVALGMDLPMHDFITPWKRFHFKYQKNVYIIKQIKIVGIT